MKNGIKDNAAFFMTAMVAAFGLAASNANAGKGVCKGVYQIGDV